MRGTATAARLADAILRSYAQVLFTDRRLAGALLVAATLVRPSIGLSGLGAVLLALGVVRLAGFSVDRAARGLYGYNPLLVGLALGAWLAPGWGTAALLAISVVAVVYLETALESALGYGYDLPVLSLPFVLVVWLALAAARFVELVHAAVPDPLLAASFAHWGAPGLYLRSLGALFFTPTPAAGALVLAALVLHSRIAVVLTLAGFAGALALQGGVFSFASDAAQLALAANGMLVAVALGGVWFVPGWSALLFAGAGVALAGLLTAAALEILRPLGLPVLFLPFNVSILVALYAMRQRIRDGRPNAADLPGASPEANLAFFRTRRERFGAEARVRLALPFGGRWVVTQGVDGPHTHRGPWRHALDFEVADGAGARHRGRGAEPSDHLCYRLPVLAPADGTVVRVVNDVPDNRIGDRNPRDPYGNLVLLQHAIGVYSLVCHLAPGSVSVTEGQTVRQGARVGACGNSGRSFVPHLHLQLQASPRIGAPTIELQLLDVVVEEDGQPVLHRARVPAEGEAVRNLGRDEDVAAAFALPIGGAWRFEVTDPAGRRREETVVSRIGLRNELFLEAEGTGARLWFENQGRAFVAYDHAGPPGGVLYLLHACALRVPFELPHGLRWDDVLLRRQLRPRSHLAVLDLVDAFLPSRGIAIAYSAERGPEGLEVRGAGEVGARPLETRARFGPAGPLSLSLRVGTRTSRARLLEVRHET